MTNSFVLLVTDISTVLSVEVFTKKSFIFLFKCGFNIGNS